MLLPRSTYGHYKYYLKHKLYGKTQLFTCRKYTCFIDFSSGCHAFSESCTKTQMPEDVTVGLVTGEQLLQLGVINEQWWLLGYTHVALICLTSIVLLLTTVWY